MKQTVRLTENKLRGMIREAVQSVLMEDWQQGRVDGGYGRLPQDDYEHNGQGVERTNYDPNRRGYNLRQTGPGGERNHTRITANKGAGANGLSYQRFGSGGNDNGQLDTIIDELAEYLGCSADAVRRQLGIGTDKAMR